MAASSTPMIDDTTYVGHPVLEGLDLQMREMVATNFSQRLPELLDVLATMDGEEGAYADANDKEAAAATHMQQAFAQMQQQIVAFHQSISALSSAGPFAAPPVFEEESAAQDTHDAEPSPGRA